MGKSWLYSLKKDDLPVIASTLWIKPHRARISRNSGTLEREYGRRPAVEVKVSGVEGLVRSLDFASMAEGSGSRSDRQEIGQELRDGRRERRERRKASRDRWKTSTA
ncbi:GD20829 [Drosophila simulans]|uniref:GD20829 n=1 Tax=Drosophila simulans TaxID=7240 RepID=B4NVA4_DROSI|nr:GD20829 [Drosophila simulans]